MERQNEEKGRDRMRVDLNKKAATRDKNLGPAITG
jgi:hypothetical protein